MPTLREVSKILAPQLPPLNLKKLAALHRWEGDAIGTGYSKILQRFTARTLLKMAAAKSYRQALAHYDLAHNGGTILPAIISARAILSRYKNDGGNRFRFLSYNTYLLDPHVLGIKVDAKPCLYQRSDAIGRQLKADYDLASLYEVWNDDVWNGHVLNNWPSPPQNSSGRGLCGLRFIAQRGRITRSASQKFRNKGKNGDSDFYAEKGVLFNTIDTGFGEIEIFSTHLFYGGGLPVVPGVLEPIGDAINSVIGFFTGGDVDYDSSTETKRSEVKLSEVNELMDFYKANHNPANVAIIAGDFNIDGNANLNRDTMDEYNREYKMLQQQMADNGFYDLWLWDVYQRPPNTGFTSRNTDDNDHPDKDFATCSWLDGDFCDEARITEPKRRNMGEGRLDYVFLQKPQPEHCYNLDVSIPRRRAFKEETRDGKVTENYLSDHLGLSFEIIVSPK